MNTVPIEDFLPFVLPFARGASEPAAVREIRSAAIEFCRRTKVWQEMLEPLDITATIQEVELIAPEDSEIERIESVFYHSTPLAPCAEDQLLPTFGITPTSTGAPLAYLQRIDQSYLVLAPIPRISESDALYVRASLIPSQTAAELPDALFKRYADEIAHGALGRLHQYHEKWANGQLAADKLGLFNAAIGWVSTRVAKSNVRSKRRVTPQYF